MANELCLDILGTTFTITADEDESYLNEVLSQFREAVENTQSISGINNPLNVAILTGFLLCDEINKMKMQLENANAQSMPADVSAEVEKRTISLIDKLDQALKIINVND